MSYTTLKQQVTDHMHRSDLAVQMDTFSLLSEGMIDKDLRVREMEKVITISYPTAVNDLPTDYLLMRSIKIKGQQGSIVPMTFVPPEQLVRYEEPTGEVKMSRAFTIKGGQIEIQPPGDITNPVEGELAYYARVLPLASNTTNPVLDNYPMIYLSAMMVRANVFVQDTEQMMLWQQTYNDHIALANRTSDEGRVHLPAMRVV